MRKNKIFIIIFQAILSINIVALCFAQEISNEKKLIEQGIKYYKSGEYDKAIESFSEVIKTSINKNELLTAYIYLGYTYHTRGEMDKAKIPIERGIELRPGHTLDEKEFVPEFIEFFKEKKEKIVGVGFFESIPPKAFVYLNNQKIGLTPIKNELLAKKYFFRLVKWGYSPVEKEIEIKNNDVTAIMIDLSKTKNWQTFLRSSLIMIAFSFLFKSL